MILREAVYPDDYAAIAAVITAENNGEYPVTAADLAAADAARDQRHFHLFMLAEEDGAAGVGSIGHIPYSYRADKYEINLRVRPERQGQGFGRGLYDALLERLLPRRPAELIAEAWEALPRPARFLSERGFQPAWRRIDSALDVRGFDFTPYAGLEERLRAQGISIVTYAGLAGDPRRNERLHELDWLLLNDMPFGEPQTKISLEEFIASTTSSPHFLPEACFITLDEGEWAGYSNLTRGEGFFDTQMTGVRQGWRGRGIATLLKLKGIAYAQAHAVPELRTTNDAVNAAMLAVNQKLGFREIGAMVRYKKYF